MADITLESLSLRDNDLGDHSSTPLRPSHNKNEEAILDATQSLTLNDTDGDVEMKDEPPRPSFASRISQQFAPRRSSPLKRAHNNLPDTDDDVSMTDDDNSSVLTQSPKSPLATLLHPTEFGARVATANSTPRLSKLELKTHKSASEDDSLLAELETDSSFDDTTSSLIRNNMDSPSMKLKHRIPQHKPRASSKLTQFVTNSDIDSTVDETTDVSTDQDTTSSIQSSPALYMTPWSKAPMPLQLHQHHHHYYSSPQRGGPNGYYEDSVILPAPWSQSAEPKAPTPYLISSYLQLLFNAITSGIAIYILISAIRTVRNDINLKMEEYAAEIALEVRSCTRSYMENRCDPEFRVAALEELCIGWERCMNRDPRVQAGKASVSAETLGMIVNSLIEPIGGKAMIVFALGFVAWAFASNFIFGFVRAKSYYGWTGGDQQQQQQQQMMLPPATPGQHQLGPPPQNQQWLELSPSRR